MFVFSRRCSKSSVAPSLLFALAWNSPAPFSLVQSNPSRYRRVSLSQLQCLSGSCFRCTCVSRHDLLSTAKTLPTSTYLLRLRLVGRSYLRTSPTYYCRSRRLSFCPLVSLANDLCSVTNVVYHTAIPLHTYIHGPRTSRLYCTAVSSCSIVSMFRPLLHSPVVIIPTHSRPCSREPHSNAISAQYEFQMKFFLDSSVSFCACVFE